VGIFEAYVFLIAIFKMSIISKSSERSKILLCNILNIDLILLISIQSLITAIFIFLDQKYLSSILSSGF